ncbi:hypothetical protein [Streptomyces sp. NPDC047108]|uniref:hypothetical protein n=1 Tax=Streptomyces sp. NPDC047108 TaxID=3155025 RepID=UPI0033F29AC7
MAGQGSGARRRAVRCVALVMALLTGPAAAAGCGASGAATDSRSPDDRTIQRMLDRRAEALLDRDGRGFLAAVDPRATGYRAQQRKVFRNLADVPLDGWRYRLVRTGGFRPAPGEGHRIAAEVRLGYRLKGYDTAPVESVQRLTLTERGGRWYIAAEDARTPDGRTRARPLWEQGEVTVVRGRSSLLLGVGQDERLLRRVARTADGAVPAVDDAWRGRWARRVVVLVPGSLQGMSALLGAPAASYRGIAAVTTGEAGGGGRAPADRVVVNPEAYGLLGETGQGVVLTHETAHVATREDTSAATPLWLSEGFADWMGYRGTGRSVQEIASELSGDAASGRLPRELPGDDDFGFAGGGGRLAAAYEGGWLACRMVAEQWGEVKLRQFYRAVGAQTTREGAVERALHDVLGIGSEAFTARWRAYVAQELSPDGRTR